jgi:hypothetical protein
MKKAATILTVTLLIAALAIPAFARGRGWGMSGGYCWQNDRNFRDFSPAQKGWSERQDLEFYEETADLRNEIWAKEGELKSLLNNSNPDRERVRTLQKEISDLYAKMDQKRLNYQLETRKNPSEYPYGRGYGGGYGRHMRGYGPGFGYGQMPGYGGGMGWNY